MENENEEKKVDTQTTGNDAQSNNANNQASKVDEIFGNTKETSENTKKEEQNNNANAENKAGTSNQNKNEGEKGKKANNVAQKNDDGSITFKNQDELDGFIARMYAKGAEKASQGETSKQKQENPEDNSKENETKEETPVQNQPNTLPSDYYQNKIGLAMAIKGINPTKLQRASRLVDQDKVIVNGNIDDAKLTEEIDAIIGEFPELVGGVNSASEQKGFKFGAAGNQTQDATDNINDELDEIFGNK